MTHSIKNLSYDDVLTEIAALQNLKEKFREDKKVTKELDESLDNALVLLDEFKSDRSDTKDIE